MEAKKILVVDDIGINRLLPGMMLRPLGFEVHECSDGAMALEYLKQQQMHVVLLDISMPVISGMDVLRAIKAMPERPLVFAYTAYADPSGEYALQQQGFDAVLIKPLSFDALLKKLGLF